MNKLIPIIIVGVIAIGILIAVNQNQQSNSSLTITPVTPNVEQEIFTAINQYRIENGLNELTYDDKIASIALSHAKDLAEYDVLQHETPGTNIESDQRGAANNIFYCGDSNAIEEFKIKHPEIYDYLPNPNGEEPDFTKIIDEDIERIQYGLSEIIASGGPVSGITDQQILPAFIEGWKNSPTHNKVMLDPHERMGVSITYDSISKRVVSVVNFC